MAHLRHRHRPRRQSDLALAAFLVLVAPGAAACGVERIDFPEPAKEAGSGSPQTETCHVNGGECHAATECCSSRCENEVCLPSGTCLGPAASCAMQGRGACCSARCEPLGAQGALTCQRYCRPSGASCTMAHDCCSLSCEAAAPDSGRSGTCGGPVCKPVGTACALSQECCSNACQAGQCQSVSSCLASGDACTDAGMPCCSGACDAVTGRCMFGSGPCLEPSSPCATSTECCRGQCLVGSNGVPVCTAPCLANGIACNTSGDCCSGHCGGAPLRCGVDE